MYYCLGFECGVFDEADPQFLEQLRESFSAPGYCVALNAEKLVIGSEDSGVRSVLEGASFRYIDGSGVALALKAKYGVSARKVNMPVRALDVADRYSMSVYFLGAAPDVINDVVKVVGESWPRISIVGARDGFFDNQAAVLEAVKGANADLVLCAMGSPKQELFARAAIDAGVNSFFVGCGGAFNVLAGRVARAPGWIQRAHLEWAYRVLPDPARWWRLPRLLKFVVRALRDCVYR